MATIGLVIVLIGVCAYILYPLFTKTAEPSSGDKSAGGRICPSCNKPVHSEDRFCSACGARLA
ncbi:MAG: zinc ribbon domain-containing protein [candidate division KSB1 bacterium]|nr:zinc ribbon domain-containing protein [candidate division KSB1 bacterium]